MASQREIEKLLEKVEKVKKDKTVDLSSDEDLSLAVMNLVSLEEHFFFSGAKTEKPEYYNLLDQIRKLRKDLMKKLIKTTEGETWCLSKHLLAASMRLLEVGTKYYSQGKKKEAEDLFAKAYEIYSLFWGVNLKIVNIAQLKKINANQLNAHDQEKTSLFKKLGEIVKKIIDCCKE